MKSAKTADKNHKLRSLLHELGRDNYERLILEESKRIRTQRDKEQQLLLDKADKWIRNHPQLLNLKEKLFIEWETFKQEHGIRELPLPDIATIDHFNTEAVNMYEYGYMTKIHYHRVVFIVVDDKEQLQRLRKSYAMPVSSPYHFKNSDFIFSSLIHDFQRDFNSKYRLEMTYNRTPDEYIKIYGANINIETEIKLLS